MRPDRRLKVLIVGLNYSPEKVGIAIYTTELAEGLARRGHDVHVVSGKPYYPRWEVPAQFHSGWTRRSTEGGVDVTRVAHYVPKKPTGVLRILHQTSFALSCLVPALVGARKQRPDVVLTVAPSLIAAPVARLAALISGARSWLHIQDFEVETAMATGLVSGQGGVARLAGRFERAVLGMFDQVSSISPAMCMRLIAKGIISDRVVEFRNWAQIDSVRPLEGVSTYRAEWDITTPHVALYSGNIANKQGLEIVVTAARSLAHRTDLTFVICGEGPNRANLEEYAAGLLNIRFHDLQPKERLGDLLGLATIHLLPQLASVSDLVLPSKLANMLASGRALVVTALSGTSLESEIAGCGLVTPPEDGLAFSAAIEQLIDNEAVRTQFAKIALQRARERWEREAIIAGFEQRLIGLVDGGKST